MISERPAEVRAVPGHWNRRRPPNGTPANRDRHPGGTSHPVCDAVPPPRGEHRRSSPNQLAATVQRLPQHLWQSLTWDQGKEMAQLAQFSIDTGSPSVFHVIRSRLGSEEPTRIPTDLLRQYFPKGTDMSRLTQTDLDKAAHSLNGRPRQTLNGMTPSEKLAEVLQ